MTAERRLRVAVITPELHREGGTERAVAEQVERWRTRFDVTVYTMAPRDVALAGVRLRRVWRVPGPHLLRYLWWLGANRVVRALDDRRGWRADVVHSPGVNALDADAIGVHIVFAKHAAARAGAAARDGGVPWARRVHRALYWRLLRGLERRVYGGRASLWALSRADAAALARVAGLPEGAVPVVPYGVDAATFHPGVRARRRAPMRAALAIGATRLVLFVGNDLAKKGFDRALAALARLGDDVRLAVAGREGGAALAMAARAGLGGRVVALPLTADIAGYYAAADCLLAPSREDAFHLPLLEAVAMGLPAVAAAEVGAVEVLGDACLVVADADDAGALAAAVTAALDAPPDGGAPAVAARDWDAYAERTGDLVVREATTPRILVLAPDAWGTGGIERATRGLLDGLGAAFGGDRVTLASLAGPPDSAPALPCRVAIGARQPPGIAGRRIALRRQLRYAWGALRAAWRLRGRGAGVVTVACHAHLAPLARACAWLARGRYLVWAYGIEVGPGMRRRDRGALARAAVVVAASRFTADRVALLVAPRPVPIVVVPFATAAPSGGVPDAPTRAAADGTAGGAAPGAAPVVLAVARLEVAHAYKGVDTLLAAWPLVVAQVAGARLVIVGDGDDRGRLERLAARTRTAGSITFVGRVDDAALAAAYAGAAVFALPGRAMPGADGAGEGFGLVYLEAAAHGVPCVAGAAGGAPEAIVDGETGLVVDGERPAEVAGAIVRLLRDPARAQAMGAAGRARVARDFTPARSAAAWTRLVRAVVARGTPRDELPA